METNAIQLPEQTQKRLQQFRTAVRIVKLAEGLFAAICGFAVSYLAVFVLDRLIDTPAGIRMVILVAGCAGPGLWLPLKCHRWIWGTRRMEQVASLVKHRFPALGDQLLGVVELAQDNAQPTASLTLARAAVEQVDQLVTRHDLSDAVPAPRHRRWAVAAAVPVIASVLTLVLLPEAGRNAMLRWLMPWRQIERYTFAQLADLPDAIVVPHGEQFELRTSLSKTSPWAPSNATAVFEDQEPLVTSLQDDSYRFEIPPQTGSGELAVRVGDLRKSVRVQVASRPELTEMKAVIQLPPYLQYSRRIETDARSGIISVLRGSVVDLQAQISRPLQSASVNGDPLEVSGKSITVSSLHVDSDQSIELRWTDELGLTAKEPFTVRVKAVADRTPMVSLQRLDSEPVVLSTDVIAFDVHSSDDFGLREIGLEWKGIEHPVQNPVPEDGGKRIALGAPEMQTFNSKATFCAVTDKVRPQSLELRAYADDFNDATPRTYSPPLVLHVLTPEEHAIWITNQLRRWASLADDVYEEEMRLYDANRELRRLPASELHRPANQQRLARQAAAERANGQRLNAVVNHGEHLIRQALRNEEMQVGHLETWADALKSLKEIAGNRMPGVADLLKKASDKAAKSPSTAPPATASSQVAGNDRSPDGDKNSAESSPAEPTGPSVSVVDAESGFNNQKEDETSDTEDSQSQGSKPRLSLPMTTLNGGSSGEGSDQQTPAQQDVDSAVEQQASLLADFAKVREELQKIMDDLENSTFVKRLKAASRKQMEVAADLNRTLFKGFGLPAKELDEQVRTLSDLIAKREEAQSSEIWTLQTDLEAYFDRRRDVKFRQILEEMEDLQPPTRLTALSQRVRRNLSGEAIARAEYWADTFDRWAEELVEPSPGGS